jgi:hypothetical protein
MNNDSEEVLESQWKEFCRRCISEKRGTGWRTHLSLDRADKLRMRTQEDLYAYFVRAKELFKNEAWLLDLADSQPRTAVQQAGDFLDGLVPDLNRAVKTAWVTYSMMPNAEPEPSLQVFYEFAMAANSSSSSDKRTRPPSPTRDSSRHSVRANAVQTSRRHSEQPLRSTPSHRTPERSSSSHGSSSRRDTAYDYDRHVSKSGGRSTPSRSHSTQHRRQGQRLHADQLAGSMKTYSKRQRGSNPYTTSSSSSSSSRSGNKGRRLN